MRILLLTLGAAALSAQVPFPVDERDFLRFALLNMASVEHSPQAVKTFEDMFAKQFDLDRQEAASFHSAAQLLKVTLTRHSQTMRTIVANKAAAAPAPADTASLAALAAEREQQIDTLLNQVRQIT